MQLILVLAVLMLFGGKSNGAPGPEFSNSDMCELLKYVSGGNDEMDKIIKQVEQVTEIVSAIAPLAGFAAAKEQSASSVEAAESRDIGLILQPVAKIADDGIYNALSAAI